VKNEAACGEFEQRTGYLSQNFAPAGGLFAMIIFILIKILEK